MSIVQGAVQGAKVGAMPGSQEEGGFEADRIVGVSYRCGTGSRWSKCEAVLGLKQ